MIGLARMALGLAAMRVDKGKPPKPDKVVYGKIEPSGYTVTFHWKRYNARVHREYRRILRECEERTRGWLIFKRFEETLANAPSDAVVMAMHADSNAREWEKP